jgi:plastocyanin
MHAYMPACCDLTTGVDSARSRVPSGAENEHAARREAQVFIRTRCAVAMAAAAIVAAGCGGGGGGDNKGSGSKGSAPASSGGGATLTLNADKSALKFDKSALSASAGKVTITMSNPSSLQHNIAIEGNGVEQKGEVVGNGGTSTVTATLKAGTYTFYCSVDGHRAAGMQGKLTVQ